MIDVSHYPAIQQQAYPLEQVDPRRWVSMDAMRRVVQAFWRAIRDLKDQLTLANIENVRLQLQVHGQNQEIYRLKCQIDKLDTSIRDVALQNLSLERRLTEEQRHTEQLTDLLIQTRTLEGQASANLGDAKNEITQLSSRLTHLQNKLKAQKEQHMQEMETLKVKHAEDLQRAQQEAARQVMQAKEAEQKKSEAALLQQQRAHDAENRVNLILQASSSGTAAGAIIGSFITPGVGTAIGAGIGVAVGSIAGAIAAIFK